jgi:hypothetical protein
MCTKLAWPLLQRDFVRNGFYVGSATLRLVTGYAQSPRALAQLNQEGDAQAVRAVISLEWRLVDSRAKNPRHER